MAGSSLDLCACRHARSRHAVTDEGGSTRSVECLDCSCVAPSYRTELPRRVSMRTDVPSPAPEPPLAQLDDFDPEHGHLRAAHGSPQYELCARGACDCARTLLRWARIWQRSYKTKPAAMTLQPPGTPGPTITATLGSYAEALAQRMGWLPDPTAKPAEGVRVYSLQVFANRTDLLHSVNSHREVQLAAVWPDEHPPRLVGLMVQVVPA